MMLINVWPIQVSLFSVILTLLICDLLLLVHSSSGLKSEEKRAGVDCTKKLFHPQCRGIIAKRDSDMDLYGHSWQIREPFLDAVPDWAHGTSYLRMMKRLMRSYQQKVPFANDQEASDVGLDSYSGPVSS